MVPPSVLDKMVPVSVAVVELKVRPTAQQSDVVGHETSLREPFAMGGMFSACHVTPPSNVADMA